MPHNVLGLGDRTKALGTAIGSIVNPPQFLASVMAIGMLTSGTGCATPRMAVVDAAYCAPPQALRQGWDEDPEPDPKAASSLTGRRARISALLGLHALTATTTDDATARLRTLERLEAARLDIAAASAELDCEGERADQIGDALADHEASTSLSFTVASLAAAAVTGIVSGILLAKDASNGAQAGVAIVGAGAVGGLGLAALIDHSSTEYHHQRNLLSDVWNGPAESLVYPPVVWAYLSRRAFSNDGQAAIRTAIVRRWQSFGVIDDARAKLFFGNGGTYDAQALHTRSAMLDQVKAEVELLNQELAELANGSPSEGVRGRASGADDSH